MKTQFKPNMYVRFDSTAKDASFTKGQVLLLTDNDDSGTEENPAFVAKDTGGNAGYVFASELAELSEAETAKLKSEFAQGKKEAESAKESKKAEAKPKTKTEAPAKSKGGGKVNDKTNGKTKEAAPALKTSDAKKKADAKAAKSAAKAAPETKPEAEFKHSPSVLKLIGTGASALKAAEEIAGRIDGEFYTLGGVLFAIKQKAYFEKVLDDAGQPLTGKAGFEQYIRAKLGIEYRMAMHYIAIYTVTRNAGIPEASIRKLKSTKVVAMLGLIENGAINKDNWAKWETKAKELKGDAFHDEVKKAYVDAGVEKAAPRGPKSTMTSFKFVLFDDRAKVVEKALAKAAKKLPPPEDGSQPTPSACFDLIVTEWLESENAG